MSKMVLQVGNSGLILYYMKVYLARVHEPAVTRPVTYVLEVLEE
jgi:hypothetical protein